MQSLRSAGYDDVRWFADLRPKRTYGSARSEGDQLEDATVVALAIAYGGPSYTLPSSAASSVLAKLRDGESLGDLVESLLPSDAEPSGQCFLLIELDEAGGVISDFVEQSVEEAKEHGAARADAEAHGLDWEPVPEGSDPAAFVSQQLGRQ